MKPPKPSADFPLYAHASRKWAKKINGKLRYFGHWDDPAGALSEYLASIDTVTVAHGLTIAEACKRFMDSKRQALAIGELAQSSFADYRRTCDWVREFLGSSTPVDTLTPTHFAAYKAKLAERRSVLSLGNEVTRVRVLFSWCFASRLIANKVDFGPDFRKPSRKLLRRHKRERGAMLFDADQIHQLLDEAGLHLRAMILLGINCGFGNTDCVTLPKSAVDLNSRWVRYPRPKTEVERDCPLWPETVDALRLSLARRPASDSSLFFLRYGGGKEWIANDVSKQFRACVLRAGMRQGGFYWLRHTFATVASGSKDQIAVNAIMGHVDASMAATYREAIDPARLDTVTAFVRNWLFG